MKAKTIDLNSISFIEAKRCYAKIFYKNKEQAIASKPLANYEKKLNPVSFMRCHRAFLVNIESVKKFEKKTRLLETCIGHKIPVSRRKLKQIAIIMEQKTNI